MSVYTDERFTKYITNKDDIKVILELGSRDLQDAILMKEYYNPVKIISFECNPDSLKLCEENIKEHKDITLVKCAVWDKNEKIKFYPVTNGNIGASSAFKVTGEYPYEYWKQKEIFVNAIRLDSWLKSNKIEKVDMICADIQGALLKALIGLGTYLKDVKYIIAEIEKKAQYIDQSLFPEIDLFLKENNFKLLADIPAGSDPENPESPETVGTWFGDYFYRRKN